MAVEGFLYYGIVALIELHVFRSIANFVSNLIYKCKNNDKVNDEMKIGLLNDETEDENVIAERRRILDTPEEKLFASDHLIFK